MFAPNSNYQVFKRPMNEAERKGVDKVYKNAQKQVRPAGVFALLFAMIGIFAGSATIDLSTSRGTTTLVILLVGLLAFGLGFYTFKVRGLVRKAHEDGNAVIVRGPASRSTGRANTSAMMIGPLTIGWNSKSVNPLREGSLAEIAVIPKLRSVVSINGIGLDRPIRIVVPTDLEASASMAPPAHPVQPVNAINPPEKMSFCPSCGAPNGGMAFCANCGSKF